MLLRCGAKNFYSFKEGVEISFELPKHCPATISKGNEISNIICVKGANGSGKTNLLKIPPFLGYFCSASFALNDPDKDIAIDSYLNNLDPIDIYCDFEVKGIKYSYNVSLTKRKVISEELYRVIRRATPVFIRHGNELIKYIKEFSDLDRIIIRSNASLISTAFQYEVEAIKDIHLFFRKIESNVTQIGRVSGSKDYKRASKYYNENNNIFELASNIIKYSDIGIKNISLHKMKNDKNEDIYQPVFEHETDEENINNKLNFFYQSSGTQELYSILPLYCKSIFEGAVLVLDEFDINLHPDILKQLVMLFDDEQINTSNAQLIFSTHHQDIIDYMGKYRTMLVNKEKSESYAYRLDEIEGDILRNVRPISPIYKSGKIGGVPKVTMYGK